MLVLSCSKTNLKHLLIGIKIEGCADKDAISYTCTVYREIFAAVLFLLLLSLLSAGEF